VAGAACVSPVQGADADELQRALGALCQPRRPFMTASHTLAAAAHQRQRQQAWLQQQLLTLDGTLHMLQLGGPWRQRLHRLAIKLQEAVASAKESPAGPWSHSPWDCGLLKTDPAALKQAAHFTPRRPTLMVAWELPPESLAPLVATLQQRESSFARPVRLWVLDRPSPA